MTVTKTIDLSGTSTQSLEAAIEEAVYAPALTISDVQEFEVEKITGTVKNGRGGRVPRLAQGHLRGEGDAARVSRSSQTNKPSFAMPYPGIFRVTCPTPFPGLPHVHVYIARGAGGRARRDRHRDARTTTRSTGWSEGVEFIGREITDIEAIYLTHCHPDHFGGAGLLQEASGAPVICHPLAKDQLERMATPNPDRFETHDERLRRARTSQTRERPQMDGRARGHFFSQMVLPERHDDDRRRRHRDVRRQASGTSTGRPDTRRATSSSTARRTAC